MAWDVPRFERYAMQAEQMAAKPPRQGLDIYAVGEAVSMSQEDSLQFAEFLRDSEWAVLNFQNGAWLRLTYKGFCEIKKLRRPLWRRWTDDNRDVLLLWMTVVSTLAAVLSVVCLFK